MNSKDRVLKALAFQKSDRIPVVPFIITFAAKYGGFRFIEYATNTSILAQCQIAVAKRFKIDAVYVDSDPIIEIEAMGARVRYPEDESPSVLEPTVKSLNDIQSLTLPDPEKDGRLPVWINAIRILKEKVGNEFAVFANINGPFLAAAQLLGMLETAKCMRRSPDVLLELMDLTTQTIVNFMKAEIQAGADAIILGDPMSSSSVISPKNSPNSVSRIFRKLFVRQAKYQSYSTYVGIRHESLTKWSRPEQNTLNSTGALIWHRSE